MRPSWIQNGCGCVDHTNICEGSYKIALNIGNPLPLVLLILPLSSIQWIEQTVQVVRHCTVVQYRQTAQYPVSRKNRLICKGILSAIIGIGQYIYIYIYINLRNVTVKFYPLLLMMTSEVVCVDPIAFSLTVPPESIKIIFERMARKRIILVPNRSSLVSNDNYNHNS